MILFYFTFFTVKAHTDYNELSQNSAWDRVCRDLKPVHVFYEDYDNQISCRLRGAQDSVPFDIKFIPDDNRERSARYVRVCICPIKILGRLKYIT